MQVIGQGNVLLHTSSFSSNQNDGVTAMTVDLPITHAGLPRVKVLGVVARDDGELVADLIEIPVTCQLENQVGGEHSDGGGGGELYVVKSDTRTTGALCAGPPL